MTRILFTGYAPVHFVCFKPIFDRLLQQPGIEVLASGGLRIDEGDTRRHDTSAMYERFDLPPHSVVDADQLPELDVDMLFSANTKPVPPRSYRRSTEIFHGLSFRNRAVRSESTTYDHYFVLGPYQHRRLEQRGVVRPGDSRAVQIGFPKTDRLLDGSLDRTDILDDLGFSGSRPLIMYAPTGAHHNSLETYGEDVIKRLAATDAYDLLVKPHDHPKAAIDWYERLAPLETEHLRLLRAPDAIPALYSADLLISDASSIANEYLLLDRPIVFLDVPELLDAAAAEDDRLDLDTWGRKGGTVAVDPASAEQAVAAGLAAPEAQSDIRRRIATDLFYNPGRATQAAVEWIRSESVSAA